MADETVYYLGESGTLGFPVIDPVTGGDMALEGLELRVRIEDLDRVIVIPGYAASGDFVETEGAAPVFRGSVVAIDVTPDDMPPFRGTYDGRIEINEGSGWRALPEGDILIMVEDL